MIYLAYDGSLNGDWVFRYALRFASHSPEKALTLVHVQDGGLSKPLFEEKLERIGLECRLHGVGLCLDVRPGGRDVFATLASVIPDGPESMVVCGTRVRSRHKAYLRGTVAEKLLYSGRFSVLAMRVVHPGLLGNPHHFLIPLAGHPRGFRAVWPFIRLFLPDVKSVCLMRGMPVHPLRHPYLSAADHRLRREEGGAYLSLIREEIIREIDVADIHLDFRTVVCDDWPGEILVHASQLKSQMILLGASERTLAQRALRANPLERMLRDAPCDLGVYRGVNP